MKCDNMNVLMCILLIIILILVIKYFISNKTKEGFAYAKCTSLYNPGSDSGEWGGETGAYKKYYNGISKKGKASRDAYNNECTRQKDGEAAAAKAAAEKKSPAEIIKAAVMAASPELEELVELGEESPILTLLDDTIEEAVAAAPVVEKDSAFATVLADTDLKSGNGCEPHSTAKGSYQIVTCDTVKNPWPVAAKKVDCINDGKTVSGWSLKTRTSKLAERQKQCLDKGGIGKDTSGIDANVIRKSRSGETDAIDLGPDRWVKDVDGKDRWKCDSYSDKKNNNFCKDHRCSIEPIDPFGNNKWKRCGDNGEWCTTSSQGGPTDASKRKTACITSKTISDEATMNKSDAVGWMCTEEGKNWLGNKNICKSHKCNIDPTDYDTDRNIWKICDNDKWCTRTIQKQKIDSDARKQACKQAHAKSGSDGSDGAGADGSNNDCSCNEEMVKQNVKELMSKSEDKLKINIADGSFTCVGNDGISPAVCPWD